MAGEIRILKKPKDLAVLFTSYNHAYLRIRLDRNGGGGNEGNLWLSTYGRPPGRRERVGKRFAPILQSAPGTRAKERRNGRVRVQPCPNITIHFSRASPVHLANYGRGQRLRRGFGSGKRGP